MERYYKKFILFIIPLFFIFISYDVNAATLTSYSSNYDSCSASNRFTFTNIDTMGNWNYFTGTIGSVISNVPNSMQFDFKYDLSAMKYYDVKFTMTGYDIYSSVNSSMVSISNGSSCGDLSNNNVALVSFTKSSSSNSRYKVMTFRIYSATAVGNWSILLENTSAIAGPENFGISSITINEVDVSNTDAIIGNQNNNTNSIIDNQNKNNEELKDTIENNFNSCHPSRNLFPGWIVGQGINSTNGSIITSDAAAISSDYISVNFSQNSVYSLSGLSTNLRTFVAAYNSNKEFLGRTGASYVNVLRFGSDDFSSGTAQGTGQIAYIRITSYNAREGDINQVNDLKTMLNTGSSYLSYEEYGKEVCTNKLDDVNSGLNDINGSINNSDVDSNLGTGFFNDFNNEDFGLSEIITIPLNTISSLTSKTCQPLSIPIPKTSRNINLPCMTQVYQQNIPSIFTIWQVVSFGIIAYFIAIDIFHLVKGFKDPDSDKVEVLDL